MVVVAPEKSTVAPKADLIDFVDVENPNIATWLYEILAEASELDASDVLIEYRPETIEVVTQVRIDGIMRRYYRVGQTHAMQALNSFKTRANLRSGANLLPQDSVLKMEVPSGLGTDEDGNPLTVERKARIQSFTTSDTGTAIAVRLPPRGKLKTIHQLGFTKDNKQGLIDLLEGTNKMVILAGPMGVGKSTTAYACLDYLNDGSRTIWSLEDPVERDIPGVIQLEAREEQGTGYAKMLPPLVRSDYNTLFLGELRDEITAGAAVRQSRAGRQVITTIHANDNVSAMIRLVELANDTPYSVLDSVQGVVSQRLVARLNTDWDGEDPFTKYKGRVPIHEIMVLTPDIVDALVGQESLATIRKLVVKNQPQNFWHNAESLIADGVTDLEEIERVLGKKEE
ncbi:GspE/PulE family protein [Glutamicibacter ardleyensis]|uniref:GspE/PulE family protein n=1 Tax=Glutamicibacter ardleyensis TaxID=225894 RepID=UPI003FD35139